MSPTSTMGWPPAEAAFLPTEPPCLEELERIQIQEASRKKPGEGVELGSEKEAGEGRPRDPLRCRDSSSWALWKTLSPEEALA